MCWGVWRTLEDRFTVYYRPTYSSSAGTGSSILSALQDIFSVSWLNRSKVEKQLQVISVLQWVLSFLVLGKHSCGRGEWRWGDTVPWRSASPQPLSIYFHPWGLWSSIIPVSMPETLMNSQEMYYGFILQINLPKVNLNLGL